MELNTFVEVTETATPTSAAGMCTYPEVTELVALEETFAVAIEMVSDFSVVVIELVDQHTCEEIVRVAVAEVLGNTCWTVEGSAAGAWQISAKTAPGKSWPEETGSYSSQNGTGWGL